MAIYDYNGNLLIDTAEKSLKQLGEKIVSGSIHQIRLFGDSITDGYGGTGYNGNQSSASGSTNTAGYCWSNVFKKFLSQQYGTTVINNGLYGSTLAQQITYANSVLSADDDLVIWLTGTNNRNSQAAYDAYPSGITSAKELLSNAGVNCLFIGCIPSTEANENDHYKKTIDMNNLVIKGVGEDFPFFSGYIETLKYCADTDTELSSLFYDHVHPNDAGYLAIFKILCNKLDIPINAYVDYSRTGTWWSN